jgi:hypothetical protein
MPSLKNIEELRGGLAYIEASEIELDYRNVLAELF